MTADVHALAGAYALDALPDDERAFFERHLAACDACRQEVEELTETAAQLGTAAAETPPPDLRAKILAAADVTRQLPPEPELAATPPGVGTRRPRRWLAAVAASLGIAVIALAGVSLDLNRRLDSARVAAAENDAMVRVLGAFDLQTVAMDGDVPGRFLFSPWRDEGILVAEGLDSPGDGKTYELWLIHDGTPVPAGLFRPDADGAAMASVDGVVRGAELVAVTIEPEGGSARPTGAILASAEL